MRTPVAFIHTSPAAIPPIMRFYAESAPDLEVTNLLDDGILRFFSANDMRGAASRLASMIDVARDIYGAKVALVTCSSVSTQMARELESGARLPVIKIDDPMAEEAVRAGRRIGVAITFAPTTEPTQRLLRDAAARQGLSIETVPFFVEGAYAALLGGEAETHDELLVEGVRRLDEQGVDAIVLAQVSMVRILPLLEGRIRVPVFSSLTSSIGAIRRVLEAQAATYSSSQ